MDTSIKPTLPLDVKLRRSPVNNQHLTKSLFREFGGGPFSLRWKDHGKTHYSLYRLYMDQNDPSEYEFALAVFGDWEHWEILSKSPFIQEYLNKWRAELEQKTISDLYHRLKQDAMSEGKSAASSAKYLLDKMEKKEGGSRGRPRNTQYDRAEPTFTSSTFKEDYERIKQEKVN